MDKQRKGHIDDLAIQARDAGYLTATSFFGVSDRAEISSFLKNGNHLGSPYLYWGGYEEAERCLLFFLPPYLSQEDLPDYYSSYLCLLRIKAKGGRFASDFTHRDVLGALMSLGIKREGIGDILLGEKEAEVYVISSLKEEIIQNLGEIKNNKVSVEEIPFSEASLKPNLKEATIQVPSLRLDAILAESFSLSREEAKREILGGHVFVSGMEAPSPDDEPMFGAHISCKGKGKILYLGKVGTSRKGKDVVSIKIYC